MAREIRLNAFAMNCVGHQSPGLWRHPRDTSAQYRHLPYWLDLARTLERGRFDGIFLADVLGVYDVHGGSPDAALRSAAQVPVNDPLLVVPAMAAVTEHLGFGVTSTLTYEPPFPFARRMSTLDHLTGGRVGHVLPRRRAEHRRLAAPCRSRLRARQRAGGDRGDRRRAARARGPARDLSRPRRHRGLAAARPDGLIPARPVPGIPRLEEWTGADFHRRLVLRIGLMMASAPLLMSLWPTPGG